MYCICMMYVQRVLVVLATEKETEDKQHIYVCNNCKHKQLI